MYARYLSLFGKQSSSEPSFQQLEIVPLSSPALLAYLQSRGINIELAKRECSEARFTHNGKWYFAIAFPNGSGGFEVRNRYFKGLHRPKGNLPHQTVWESEEYLLCVRGVHGLPLLLTLRQENCPNYPELDGQDYIVLNSVSNVNKALSIRWAATNASTVFLITTMQAWKPSNKSARNTAETDTSVTLHGLTADART